MTEEYFAKGKRGKIYKEGNIVTKKVNPKSKAKGRIANEITFLKILNKYNIGPKLLKNTKESFSYKFIQGKFIQDALKRKNPVPIIKNILKQCYILDTLKINKKEMHHPLKHIIVNRNKVIMIDFERCYYTKKPKNVTQFMQFITNAEKTKKYNFTIDNTKMRDALKRYKEDYSKKECNEILTLIKKKE